MSSWFKDARFGMFIHWGVYSVAARGEWTFNRELISKEEYIEKYANRFTAENYDPRTWAKLAKQAGMKYMILTAKHHDGFCLFDTKVSDFNSVNYGPHKDLVREYVEAVRAEGLKVGLYYSPADWNHPDYPAYKRDWPTEWESEGAKKRFIAYYKEQLRELMTNYGKIDILWFDGCKPKGELDGFEVNTMVKELQPDIMINSRNGEPCDFAVSEQAIVPPADDIPWEACMTLNRSWGYHAGDLDYKTPKDVLILLMQVAKSGGNLLLNVGPRGDGSITEQSIEILQTVGAWLESNGDSIYGSERHTLSWGHSHHLTAKGETVYVHLCHDLTENELCIAEIRNKVRRIYCLATGKVHSFKQLDNGRLFIYDVNGDFEKDIVRTFAIELDGKPESITEMTDFWIPDNKKHDVKISPKTK